MDLQKIHIGKLINEHYQIQNISPERVCGFFQCSEEDIKWMLKQKSMDTDKLLRWSKLLEYDFFRIYSQHLILFAPKASKINKTEKAIKKNKGINAPPFRKNIYTKEIINYLLSLINTKQKTPNQIITEYKIPKTTLYRWIQKYNIKENDTET